MTASGEDILALVRRGDGAALEAALAGGADANARDRWGVSALAHAAARGQLALVETLLRHGAEVDAASQAGNTPLMAAAARGHVEVVQRLLQAGADPKRKNRWGQGAWDWARWAGGAAEVRALLETQA